MPRIRKKTSNRVKSRDREKVKKKVRDSRKKKAKLAKKNPQWKSKKPKDPGIPNEFPYKDQILGEVQEQRRIAAEEKRRLKEEKQRALARARAVARGEIVEHEAEGSESGMDQVGGQDDEDGHLTIHGDEIASISAKTITPELKFRRASPAEAETDTDDEELALVNRNLPNLASVLEKADVIMEILDARDPLAYRSKDLEEMSKQKGKKVLLILNKIDRCPREAVAAWAVDLRAEYPTLLFRSASSFLPEGDARLRSSRSKTARGKVKVPVNDAFGADSILSCLAEWAKHDEPLTVAVVGVANVGKSSLINSLLKKKSSFVYTLASSSEGPTTTELPQEVSLDLEGRKTVTFIDTPGFSFQSSEDKSALRDIRAKDILLRSKGRIDRLKDPSPSISHIVARANKEDLMLLYSLPAFAPGDSVAFLSGVARANQLVKKNGDLDLTGAARIVLRDWNVGRFARYTAPGVKPPRDGQSKDSNSEPSFLTSLYAKEAPILDALVTRKEMRMQGGLVKLSAGLIEERKLLVEEKWSALNDDGSSSDEGDDNGGAEVDVEAGDEESDDDLGGTGLGTSSDPDEDVESSLSIPLSQGRKRKGKEAFVSRPSKKVSMGRVEVASAPNQGRSSTAAALKRRKGEVRSFAHKNAVPRPKSILKSRTGAPTMIGDIVGKKRKVKATKEAPGTAGLPGTSGKQTANSESQEYDFGKFFN